MLTCDYGCGLVSKFVLKNGKNCCSESHHKCEGSKDHSRKRMILLNATNASGARKKGLIQPKKECPTCLKQISLGNFTKHANVCGKAKGSCINCGKELYTMYKTCSEVCMKEHQSICRKRYIKDNGISAKTSSFVYLSSKKEILYFYSALELNAGIVLDIWAHQGKITDWTYNTTEYINYVDLSGKDRMYFPDFKVFSADSWFWLEVKGYETPTDTLKWAAAKTQGIELKTWFDIDIKKYKSEINDGLSNKD